MAGFSYPAAVRLTAVAAGNWYEIDGACARAGIDPADLPPRRLLNLVYAWAVERLSHGVNNELQQWLDDLYKPLPGGDPDKVSAKVVEDEMAAFGAFRQEVGSGPAREQGR